MFQSFSVRQQVLAMIAVVLLLNGTCIYDIVRFGKMGLVAEGGFVENATAFCALASAFILLFSCFLRRGYDRFQTLFVGSGCLMFFLREVDVADYTVPGGLQMVAASTTKDVFFTFWFLSLFTLLFRKYREHLREWKRDVFSVGGKSLIIGLGCFGVGEAVEKFDWLVAEELLEMTGGFCILLAAILRSQEPVMPSVETQAD